MDKDLARIEKIKVDHLELLKKVKEKLIKDKERLDGSLNDVITVLNYDEESTKKYEAMVKAQELIVSLVEEIINAKDPQDIIAIRKKVNYYLSKVKKEAFSRNIPEKDLNFYMESVSTIRKDISQYLRYLKRDNHIEEIDKLFAHYDELSNEEKNTLKKKISLELSYNKRNSDCNDQVIEKSPVVEKNPEKDEFSKKMNTIFAKTLNKESKEEFEERLNHIFSLASEKVSNDDFEEKLSSVLSKASEKVNNDDFEEKLEVMFAQSKKNDDKPKSEFPFKSEHDDEDADCFDLNKKQVVDNSFLEGRIDTFNHMYKLKQTSDYGRSRGKNFIRFFRNVPAIVHNKKSIRRMENDFILYYGGSDLASYIEYTRNRNSIKNSLKCIFDRSYLFSRESRYLNRHRYCTKWLLDFCYNNDLAIPQAFGYGK